MSASQSVTFVAASASVLIIMAYKAGIQGVKMQSTRHRMIRITTWSIAMSVWPVVWYSVATPDGCPHCSRVGLLWPYFLMSVEALGNMSADNGSFKIDPGPLTSVTFAIASMLGAIHDPIRARFFMAPILINLLFLLPTPTHVGTDDQNVIVNTIREILIVISIALVVSGIVYAPPKIDL